MKKISIDIPHFYCLEYKEDEKRLIVEIDFREPLGTSLSIGSDNRTGKRRNLHKYQAVSAGAVSGPGYFGKRPGKGGQ